MPELLFCIYAILLIKIVGIFSLHFSFTGAMNYNIVPFVGRSFVPVLMNFVLFVPYGFLLLSKRISRKSVYILMERVRRWRWISRYTLFNGKIIFTLLKKDYDIRSLESEQANKS